MGIRTGRKLMVVSSVWRGLSGGARCTAIEDSSGGGMGDGGAFKLDVSDDGRGDNGDGGWS